MTELRWALLILGLLLLAAIYFYSRRQGRGRRRTEERASERAWSEPVISGESLWGDELEGSAASTRRTGPSGLAATDDPSSFGASGDEEIDLDNDLEEVRLEVATEPFAAEDNAEAEAASSEQDHPLEPDRIVAMRVAAPSGKTLPAEEMVLKLRQLGLRHGKYGIFHHHGQDADQAPIFSVANMTEPGSFDLTTLRETRLPGVSLFMVLPNGQDPVESFDTMVATARALARDLSGEILDESGSTWSIQRERYVREELIRYRLRR